MAVTVARRRLRLTFPPHLIQEPWLNAKGVHVDPIERDVIVP